MKKKILFLFFIISCLFLSGCSPAKISTNLSPTSSPTSSQTVPLPSGQDIVRTFFNLINEKRIPEAVAMLSSTAAPNEKTRQIWAVNFNTLESISPKSIEEWQKEKWTETKMTYKVIVIAKVKPNPQFFAWDNGENIKWINLIKENNLWKVADIASGP